MKDFWNERYLNEEYVYGEQPNTFFAQQLTLLPPGKIILACEGEGRNAVHAATLGWSVQAFDSSEAGVMKAQQLAQKNKVILQYTIAEADAAKYNAGSADVVAFIYAHLGPEIRQKVHQTALTWLKPGGKVILEAFNPQQLNNKTGGPKDIAMLYTEEMLREDFASLDIQMLETCQIELKEGRFHDGTANVIRLVGIKK